MIDEDQKLSYVGLGGEFEARQQLVFDDGWGIQINAKRLPMLQYIGNLYIQILHLVVVSQSWHGRDLCVYTL
jgi:hypothetical protein